MLSDMEVEVLLENHAMSGGQRAGYYLWSFFQYEESFTVDGMGLVELVSVEGGEGEGSGAELILQWEDRYFRKSGSYASYDGFYWDGPFEEVEPYEHVVTSYRKKD